ncbi:MAG: serine/threonine protein phosphatase [Clostridia bacterium]|nr:serine/threonine protein phosphatase [Clostridia bacterium]MBQ7090677.1 serine/threonine protein phosphatase [Clostridia bacterium]
MTYVMSDPHGNYDSFRKMLERIRFSDQDTLYLNGDLCDRGSESARLYLDVMARKNVLAIKGNHEVMAEEHLAYLLEEYGDQSVNVLDLFSERDLWLWFENGGDSTLISIFDEAPEDRYRIFEYIKALPYYRTVEVNGKRYIMVHGGLGNYREGTALSEVHPVDLVWTRPNFDGSYFDDGNTYLVVGHTPTILLRERTVAASIYRGRGNVIAVDCGAAYPEHGGRLGCLCLETGREFYV